jgi:hypothetical protein
MKFKKLISICLSCVIAISALCYPIGTFAKTDFTYKIDSKLMKILNRVDDNDEIAVSVWVSDIDHSVVDSKVSNKLKNKVSDDLLNIANSKGNNTNLLKLYENESTKSVKEQKQDSLKMQTVIETERMISSKEQIKSNEKVVNSVFNYDEKPEILYSCSYAPNLEMKLTKEQINRIIESNNIEEVYYIEPETKVIPDLVESTSTNGNINTNYFTVTGLSQTKSVWGLSGDGVNVGVYDAGFTLPNSVDYFAKNNIIDYQISNSCFTNDPSTHGNLVSSIIGGYQKDSDGNVVYSSSTPNVSMYWTAGSGYKASYEYLINAGCNVINMSLAVGSDGYNNYGDTAKWIDHISTQHSVHVVCSAGNSSSTGITSGKMAHNAIIVGACDNNGVLASFSSYSSSNSLPYKPDLVAPGSNITTPAGTASGTSCAAPMVTSAVAQFCQLSSVLRSNPTLMKALLLSGSKRTNYMIQNNVQSTAGQVSIAFDQMYGSGMLYTPNMYTAFHDSNYYITGSFSSCDTVYETEKNISVKSPANKILRFAVVWDKISHIVNNPHKLNDAEDVEADTFLLNVTAPNGTVYKSYYQYDTKSLISFKPSVSGKYKIELTRLHNSGEQINYSIAYSVASES